MKITYFVRNVYGKALMYPTGKCADAIEMLTRRRTLEAIDLKSLSALGHDIQQVPDPCSVQCQHEQCMAVSACTVVLHGQSARLCLKHGKAADLGNWQHIALADFIQ